MEQNHGSRERHTVLQHQRVFQQQKSSGKRSVKQPKLN
jgi:hypothetical protein